jgi:probable F420-dependent oxidoreductase
MPSDLQVGVVFPQMEVGADLGAVRAWAQAVNELGYHHAMLYDHVVGADPKVHEGWNRDYNVKTTFHEPMVLFGYLAGVTSLGMLNGILVLPQRQTVLVAKQAAEIDILTGGQYRLGVAIGWNRVEYDALGQDFSTRGRRIEEQVELLRRLWQEESVTFDGEFDHVHGVGLAPLPLQRPIPIWFGGQSETAYRRAGRLGDGWIPEMVVDDSLFEAIEIVESAARDAGRDPSDIGMEGRVRWGTGGVEQIVGDIDAWRGAGASHVAVNTMMAPSGRWRQDEQIGLEGMDEHLEALSALAKEIGLQPRSAAVIREEEVHGSPTAA